MTEQTKAQPLVGEILEYTRLDENDSGYQLAHQGIEVLLSELLSFEEQLPRIDKPFVDQMIKALDDRLGKQMDSILHAPEFQAVESAWRGLNFLVQRTEFSENIQIEILDASQEELLDAFEDAPEINPINSGYKSFRVYGLSVSNDTRSLYCRYIT